MGNLKIENLTTITMEYNKAWQFEKPFTKVLAKRQFKPKFPTCIISLGKCVDSCTVFQKGSGGTLDFSAPNIKTSLHLENNPLSQYKGMFQRDSSKHPRSRQTFSRLELFHLQSES